MGRAVHVLTLGVAVAAGGCAQIFGFDETSPYDDDGIRLSWVKKRVGATVVEEPMDLAMGSATYLVPDAADPSGLRRVPAVLEDPDTWFAELPSGTAASILYDLPEDDIWRIWAFPARTLQGVYGILGHPDAEPAPANAQLDLSVTLDVGYSTELLQMYTVGAWSYRNFPEVPAAGLTAWDPAAVPYSSSGSITGRPLERIRSSDAVALLRYLGPQLQGYLAVPPFDQQDGIDAITGTMTTVPLDQTFDAMFMTTAAGPRLTATTPAVAGLAMSWSVASTPSAVIGSSAGPALTSGGLLETDTGVITTMYGNPFPWEAVAAFSTQETRQYTPPGALGPSTLYAGMYSVVTPAPPAQVFDLPQGLPLLITVAGRALTTDGQSFTYDRTQAIEVSFVVDREACDMYSLTLYELVDNGAGVFVHTGRGAINGVAPQFQIPGDLFETGKPYTLRAVCQLGGIPNLLAGDLVTRAWPVHVGYLDSGVFTVNP